MITTVLLSILLASTSATADGSASTSVDEVQPAKPTKICKSIKMTGSRVGQRICKTKEQWDQAESASELTVKGNAGNPSPQCAMCAQNPGPN